MKELDINIEGEKIIWRKSSKPYYDVLANIIYSPKIADKTFFHELKHFKDHKNKFFRNLSNYLNSEYIQLLSVLYFITLLFFTIPSFYSNPSYSFFFFAMAPVFIIRFLEEVFADIYAFRINKKYKRLIHLRAVHRETGKVCDFFFSSLTEAMRQNKNYTEWEKVET